MATEFSEDSSAALEKYQNRVLTVTGPVSAIAQGDMTTSSPSVALTLSTQDGPGPDVKCLFENDDLQVNTEYEVPGDNSEVRLITRDSAGNITSTEPFADLGQQVTITGSFFGFNAGDIVLRHCRMGAGATP